MSAHPTSPVRQHQPDRRQHQPDRRQRRTPMLSRYWLRGRRRSGRRQGEVVGVYVDRYAPVEIGLFAALLGLSLTDLVATLWHLAAGGAELNPVMCLCLEHGGATGLALAKLLLTGAGALFLLIHVRFARVRAALWLLVAGYVCLVIWQAIVAWDRLV